MKHKLTRTYEIDVEYVSGEHIEETPYLAGLLDSAASYDELGEANDIRWYLISDNDQTWWSEEKIAGTRVISEYTTDTVRTQ
jgi:hypothetical protein